MPMQAEAIFYTALRLAGLAGLLVYLGLLLRAMIAHLPQPPETRPRQEPQPDRADRPDRMAPRPARTPAQRTAAQTRSAAPSASLTLLDPAQSGLPANRVFRFNGAASVGRAPDNQIVLPDPRVSARHAIIRLEGGRWWIEDLGSRNGTRLNGVQISGRAPLRNGDIVAFGPVIARFEAALEAGAEAQR